MRVKCRSGTLADILVKFFRFCRVAAAGSKEARELEKVKKAFEKVYRENIKLPSETKFSFAGLKSKTHNFSALEQASRLDYTAEQRKNTRPDIDKTDVVFSDGEVESNSLSDSIENKWEMDYNEDTHYGENLKDTPNFLKPSTDVEWQVFCRSFANKTSSIDFEERKITIFTENNQYLIIADGYMTGKIVSKANINLYNESGAFYDDYSRNKVFNSYDERKGDRQRNNDNGSEPSEDQGTDSFDVELDKFIESHPEYFSNIRKVSSIDRSQIISDDTDLLTEEASSTDDVFFDGRNNNFSLSSERTPKKYGNVYGEDILLEKDEDIAPVREDVVTKTTVDERC